MENYALEANEVLLFKGNVIEADSPDDEIELVLTNLHIVLVSKGETDSQEEEIKVTKHPISDIKVYKDIPQIKQKNRSVEIFLAAGEKTIAFKTKTEANKFMNAAFELLTGKTKLARSASKVKKTIDDVNEAFGVNIIEEAKNFSVDAVTRIVNNTIPSRFKLLSGKNKNKKKK